MTQNDRSEVREMIQGVLSGWHDATAEREKLIYLSLNNIDSHLEKLNGKVNLHEKTILKNLPHSIDHCLQVGTIKKIRDVVIENRGGKRVWRITWERGVTIVTLIVGFVMMWQGYKSLKHDTSATKLEIQVTNDAILQRQTRGQYFDPFVSDTIKK